MMASTSNYAMVHTKTTAALSAQGFFNPQRLLAKRKIPRAGGLRRRSSMAASERRRGVWCSPTSPKQRKAANDAHHQSLIQHMLASSDYNAHGHAQGKQGRSGHPMVESDAGKLIFGDEK